MFPLRLRIEGLYSYQTPQVIDFEKLTSNQLFGIFGKVGSGKSSILEAIMYAIYGNTERLNQREERTYNMMNLRSTEMKISFECLAGKNARERFLFEVRTQRKKSNFSQITSPERSICRWDDTAKKWIPTQQSPEEIIGMKYEHFRTTVIIPQGKFKEFVEKTDKDRTEMMKELFQLERFDLSDKVKAVKANTVATLKEKEGNLAALSDVSQEKLDEYQKLLQQQTACLAESQASFDKISNELAKLETLRQLIAQRQETENAYRQHLSKESTIQQKQHTIEKYQYFHAHLRPILLQIKEHQKLYEEHEAYVEKLQRTLKEKEALLSEKKYASEKATQAFNSKAELEKKLEDFGRIIELRKKDEQKKLVHQTALQLEAKLIKAQGEQEKLMNQIAQEEKEILSVTQHQINIGLLNELREWYLQNSMLKKDVELEEQTIAQLDREMQRCQQEKSTVLLENGFEKESTLAFSDVLQRIDLYRTTLEQEKETLQHELDTLKWQVELSKMRQHLVEGEPCPLCGATEHTLTEEHNPVLQKKLSQKQDALMQLDKKLQNALSVHHRITHLAERFGEAQLNKQERQLVWEEKNNAYQQHQSKFYWVEFSVHDQPRVEKLIKEYHQQQLTLQQHHQTLDTLRKQLTQLQQQTHQLDLQFAAKKQEILTLENWMNEEKAKLQQFDYVQYATMAIPTLENNFQKGREKLLSIEQDFVRTQQELNQAEIDFNNLNTKIINEQESARKLSRTINTLQATLDEKIRESTFFQHEKQLESMATVYLDIAKMQQEIQAYYEQKAVLASNLEKIQQLIGENVYQEETYQQLQQTHRSLKNQLVQLTQEIGALNNNVAYIKKKLAEKQRLLEEKKQLEIRKANLDTLEDLFKGKGFVEFVSTTYLKDLVAAANQRFLKLTHHQLSLELDEKNDFIVRDYLNEGKTRLLKTLSGGQMFQACLSLALALAENVKSLNQAERSFFFIDEGFGTLDKESLKTVFETLQSLQQEKRVVGVISHVEELQQEINVFLRVEKDEKNGSILRPSWGN